MWLGLYMRLPMQGLTPLPNPHPCCLPYVGMVMPSSCERTLRSARCFSSSAYFSAPAARWSPSCAHCSDIFLGVCMHRQLKQAVCLYIRRLRVQVIR